MVLSILDGNRQYNLLSLDLPRLKPVVAFDQNPAFADYVTDCDHSFTAETDCDHSFTADQWRHVNSLYSTNFI